MGLESQLFNPLCVYDTRDLDDNKLPSSNNKKTPKSGDDSGQHYII